MFEGVLRRLLSGFAAAALPMLALLSQSETVFPPAPFFLLALGVGLLIGLGMLAISTRQPSEEHAFLDRWF